MAFIPNPAARPGIMLPFGKPQQPMPQYRQSPMQPQPQPQIPVGLVNALKNRNMKAPNNVRRNNALEALHRM